MQLSVHGLIVADESAVSSIASKIRSAVEDVEKEAGALSGLQVHSVHFPSLYRSRSLLSFHSHSHPHSHLHHIPIPPVLTGTNTTESNTIFSSKIFSLLYMSCCVVLCRYVLGCIFDGYQESEF